MYCVTVLYPNAADGHFDFDYYRNVHIPHMLELLGDNVQGMELRRGLQAVDGAPAVFHCLLNTHVRSAEDFQRVMADHADWVLADIPKYTNLQPIIQIDQVL
ncbi:MAG: EthD family reductase [Pseudomonas sp.]|uniref:EthD family reductase n=1 Tax=Pseudomonas sp. TaxID=306 RepID=UPI003392994C